MSTDFGLPGEVAGFPIRSVLDRLLSTLDEHPAALLTAPPGAGKTTLVPLALAASELLGGKQIVVLQPRRLAARAVARRMARLLDEPVGRTVGYSVRFEEKRSASTRILVVTEGLLIRHFLSDPLLENVGCVMLDEFHERSIHTDLCLAFCKELLQVRSDLRLLIMSATLQAEPLRRYLDDCPQLHCPIPPHPVQITHDRLVDSRPLPARVRSAIGELMAAPDDDDGDILVFLSGAAEIRACREMLARTPLPAEPEVVELFGGLSSHEQDRALAAGQRRRVVLSTNIAETSLTVPGVTAVVDTGRVKRPVFDPRTGMNRLDPGRVSRASADQRAGRAGRTRPGRVRRLWTEGEGQGLIPFEPAQVTQLDPAEFLLPVMAFHPGHPARFDYFEPPDPVRLESALSLLSLLGAVNRDGSRLTSLGRRLADLPLHPRIGAMLLKAAACDQVESGTLMAALLQERFLLARSEGRQAPLPNSDSDLLHLQEVFQQMRQAGFTRAAAVRLGVDFQAARDVQRAERQLCRFVTGAGSASTPTGVNHAQVVLAGFPDRVCKRRTPGSDLGRMVGGRGVRLSEASGVRQADLFVALQAEAGPRGTHATDRVFLAEAVTTGDLAASHPGLLAESTEAVFDEGRQAVIGVRRLTFADLIVDEQSGVELPANLVRQTLAREADDRFDKLFMPDAATRQLIARLRLMAGLFPNEGLPPVDPEGLRARLPDLCRGKRTLAEVSAIDWRAVILAGLSSAQRKRLDWLLPERIQVPSGSRVAIDYHQVFCEAGAPVLKVKLQEMFGWSSAPRLADGRVDLLLHLLSPSGRPVQVTRDLASFWREGYPAVRKQLRGRYPRHPWPEDPLLATPTRGTKKRSK